MKLDNITENFGRSSSFMSEPKSTNDQPILIQGVGRMTVGQARQKLDQYLKELSRLSEESRNDPDLYTRIGAIYQRGAVGAFIEALSQHYQQ